MLILKSPKFDADSARWIEPMDGLKLKVGSVSNPAFRSHNAIVRRHISRLDEHFKVGTPEFNPAGIDASDVPDDLLIDSVAKYVLLDWEGVGEEVDGKEQAVTYTPEKGKALLSQNPELYWAVLTAATEVAEGKEQQKQETVGKSSKPSSGSESTAENKAKRTAGGASA